MILPDDGLSDSKFGSSSTNLPTHTQNNIHHRSASPSLPDYETSEAQHNPQRSRRAKRSVARRFLRAACIVLSIYVGLVFIFGFRFYITRSRDRATQWALSHHHFPWEYMHAHHNSPNLLSDEDAAKCRPWQTFTDPPPGELFSASFENPVPAGGTFAFRTNISSSFPDAHSLRSISGTFTLSFYRAPSIEQALLSLQVQASTRQLRERVYVCFANDTQSGETNVDIYVPDVLNPGDKLNFTLTLLLPSLSPPTSDPLSTVDKSYASSSSLSSAAPLEIKQLTTQLPGFTHHFNTRTMEGIAVIFQRVNVEGASSRVYAQDMHARKVSIKTGLAEIVGTFNVSDGLILDTIGAPINANITLSQSLPTLKPTYLGLETGQAPIDVNVRLHSELQRTRSYFPFAFRPSQRFKLKPRFAGSVKTFDAPLNVTVVSDIDLDDAEGVFEFHAQTSMADCDISVLGPGEEGEGAWYEGTFMVKTKLGHAYVLDANPNATSTRIFEYDVISPTRLVGMVRRRRNGHLKARGKDSGKNKVRRAGALLITNSMGNAVLRFGRRTE